MGAGAEATDGNEDGDALGVGEEGVEDGAAVAGGAEEGAGDEDGAARTHNNF